MPRMRWSALLPAFLGAAAAAQPVLRCEVTYAGAPHRVEARPGTQPYAVQTVDIAGRFRFKAVFVQGDGLEERIGLYVYVDADDQPVLVQHARYLPPYAANLTGEQHVYAGPLERELIYRCTVAEASP